MGQDIIDQRREVKDVISFTASSCRQSQLRTFQHFYYKKNQSYYINVSKTERLEHVPNTRFVYLVCENYRALRPNNKLSCRSNFD